MSSAESLLTKQDVSIKNPLSNETTTPNQSSDVQILPNTSAVNMGCENGPLKPPSSWRRPRLTIRRSIRSGSKKDASPTGDNGRRRSSTSTTASIISTPDVKAFDLKSPPTSISSSTQSDPLASTESAVAPESAVPSTATSFHSVMSQESSEAEPFGFLNRTDSSKKRSSPTVTVLAEEAKVTCRPNSSHKRKRVRRCVSTGRARARDSPSRKCSEDPLEVMSPLKVACKVGIVQPEATAELVSADTAGKGPVQCDLREAWVANADKIPPRPLFPTPVQTLETTAMVPHTPPSGEGNKRLSLSSASSKLANHAKPIFLGKGEIPSFATPKRWPTPSGSPDCSPLPRASFMSSTASSEGRSNTYCRSGIRKSISTSAMAPRRSESNSRSRTGQTVLTCAPITTSSQFKKIVVPRVAQSQSDCTSTVPTQNKLVKRPSCPSLTTAHVSSVPVIPQSVEADAPKATKASGPINGKVSSVSKSAAALARKVKIASVMTSTLFSSGSSCLTNKPTVPVSAPASPSSIVPSPERDCFNLARSIVPKAKNQALTGSAAGEIIEGKKNNRRRLSDLSIGRGLSFPPELPAAQSPQKPSRRPSVTFSVSGAAAVSKQKHYADKNVKVQIANPAAINVRTNSCRCNTKTADGSTDGSSDPVCPNCVNRMLDSEGVGYTCRKGLKPDAPNQDDFFIISEPEYSMFAVFDGHGPWGHKVSNAACNEFQRMLPADPKFGTAPAGVINGAFRKVQNRLKERARSTASDDFCVSISGSTATVIHLKHHANSKEVSLVAAHVGDSRAVLGRRSKADSSQFHSVELTNDHKPNNEHELSRIIGCGGVVRRLDNDIPHRVFLKGHMYPGLAMSRALGDVIASTAGVTCEPDVSEFRVRIDEGNFLLICSDGVWEFISSDEAVQLVAGWLNAGMSVQKIVDTLALESRKRWIDEEGSVVDDITVIVVLLDKLNNVGS